MGLAGAGASAGAGELVVGGVLARSGEPGTGGQAGAGGFVVRQSSAPDRAAIRCFLAALSPGTSYLRFFGAPPTGPAVLRLLAGGRDNVDALVAVASGAVIGHAMAVDEARSGGSPRAEIGVVVGDAWQGRGVGAALVRALAQRAVRRGVTTLVMDVLAENRRVRAMISGHWPGARWGGPPDSPTIAVPLLPSGPPVPPAAGAIPEPGHNSSHR